MVGPLATVGLFDHHGHQVIHVLIESISHFVSLTRIIPARLASPARPVIYFPTEGFASRLRVKRSNRHPCRVLRARPCFRSHWRAREGNQPLFLQRSAPARQRQPADFADNSPRPAVPAPRIDEPAPLRLASARPR